MTKFYAPNTRFAHNVHKACREGDLQFVLEFINSENNQNYLKENPSLSVQMLIFASMKGHFHICEAIWNAPQLSHFINNINNSLSLKNLLSKGFDGGNLEVVEFFQEKLNKKKTSNNQKPLNYNKTITSGLISASSKGHLAIIKHFFFNETYSEIIDFEYTTGSILYAACENNQIQVLQFLLETDGIKEKYDIHKDNDCLFKLAYENNHTDILKYLIFNLNIEKTSNIEQHLINRSRSESINHMFETRELQKSLGKELPSNKDNQINKKLKV
jgi:hypothetical protein